MSQIIEYQHEAYGVSGWLVYDDTRCRLAAGGFRVHSDLTVETLQALASRMTLKQRLLGINVDGAKCGLAYDPRAAGKPIVVRHFFGAMRGELMSRMSMGCDMGTRWDELQNLASAEGIPSTKYAVKNAQQYTEAEFQERLTTLHQMTGPLSFTLAQRRAGHALAEIAIAAAQHCGMGRRPSVGLQGFGNLGRAAACSLLEAGVPVMAIADEFGSISDPRGLPIGDILATPHETPVPSMPGNCQTSSPDALFEMPYQMLILAAHENAMSEEQAAVTTAEIVVVGANCGLSSNAEKLLHERSVVVVPDFVGGIGGSASMEALFGPAWCLTPREVLDTLGGMARALVCDLIENRSDSAVSIRDRAMALVGGRGVDPDAPPYGSSPYLLAALAELFPRAKTRQEV